MKSGLFYSGNGYLKQTRDFIHQEMDNCRKWNIKTNSNQKSLIDCFNQDQSSGHRLLNLIQFDSIKSSTDRSESPLLSFLSNTILIN